MPSAVVRFKAKTLTSVTRTSAPRVAKVPTMDTPPTSSGSRPATTLPKTSSSSTRVSGTARDSALARSFVTLPFTSTLPCSGPPVATSAGPRLPVNRGRSSFAALSAWS